LIKIEKPIVKIECFGHNISHLIEVKAMGNPTNIHMNLKEGALSQPTRFLECALSLIIGGQEHLGASLKEVVDQI
jgi:hypothetical protein